MNKLLKLKYLSSFRPLFFTVWTLLLTGWRCRGLLLHLTTHTHTQTHTQSTHTTQTTHIHGWFLLDEESL